MVFLFNLVKKSAFPKGDTALMAVSLTIFLFYLFSDPLIITVLGFDILHSSVTYLFWFSSNLVCLLIILRLTSGTYLGKLPAKLYIIIGLTVSMLLFLAMHIDINVLMNYEPWWFWTFYSITVNVMDVMMIIALLTNKDFLGLLGCYRWVFETKQSA
ncbi:hypothetical protein [Pseudoalteromonas sp. A601]|uniref:hypothetical protein n=1 Tax=Pseudoalteromonas sp. A601 TaxID=1967839 RepID=UPI00111D4852|nr:hypothetical protein [Pseudoalteromonas sp. A601]